MKPSDLPRTREPLTYKEIQARMFVIVVVIGIVVSIILSWVAR